MLTEWLKNIQKSTFLGTFFNKKKILRDDDDVAHLSQSSFPLLATLYHGWKPYSLLLIEMLPKVNYLSQKWLKMVE